jgi:hypothetical protein
MFSAPSGLPEKGAMAMKATSTNAATATADQV